MEQELQRRIARNEAVFRQVNETLQQGRWPGEGAVPIAFRCECGQLGCSRLIELTSDVYEQIREHPRRFLLAPDHDIPATEMVVERRPSYIVVEKIGAGGPVAEATDPRAASDR